MSEEELDAILTSLNANMETASVMRHLRAENEKLMSRIESAEEAYVCLESAMYRLQEVFHVNMRKWFSNMSREEIDAEIAAAIKGRNE